MIVGQTDIPGCYAVSPESHDDSRGSLTKTFVASALADAGVAVGPFREQFHTCSGRGVLRGMHVQAPPADGDKLVVCVFGEALDVVVDLRVDSPGYRRVTSFELRARGDSLLVPAGVAHGFYVTSDECIMAYSTTYEYAAESDGGVHWASIGFDWPDENPVVSTRDERLPRLADYGSPFVHRLDGTLS